MFLILKMSGDKLDLCDPFPLTMGCQIFTSGPSGTMQKYQGVCEFPHNVMHRRVFMAFFVLYHILIVGFVVNFCYIVLVLVSPKCRLVDVEKQTTRTFVFHVRIKSTNLKLRNFMECRQLYAPSVFVGVIDSI